MVQNMRKNSVTDQFNRTKLTGFSLQRIQHDLDKSHLKIVNKGQRKTTRQDKF